METDKQNLYDVVVIGAGQAGLAMGYYLHLQRKNFLMLDGASQVGQSWRDRYDSLRLFTPAEYCNLPGWPLLMPKGHYPTKDQIADYLQQYAQQFQLPIQLEQRVTSFYKAEGAFYIATSTHTFRAKQVVIAAGPFQKPYIPNFVTTPADHVVQLHSAYYRNPGQLPAGKVLVVGAGNSGAQIAVELAKTHEVHLSVRKKPRFSSLRMLGKSVFWWATKTGAIYASPTSRTGRKVMKKTDIVYGKELQQLLKKGQVPLRPEISGFAGATVQF
ncbi:flavin-containing monooxygenase [Rufibacter roseus]|uniref:Flavin-containing monooxygenase n=1 Tax=Rufibacter roseus TaxID=1567108 RepID=A0ABW2DPQ7_9BACT|nr:NAD(P)/FAD-dependent oxidoreductase [Rufibacter roseus]